MSSLEDFKTSCENSYKQIKKVNFWLKLSNLSYYFTVIFAVFGVLNIILNDREFVKILEGLMYLSCSMQFFSLGMFRLKAKKAEKCIDEAEKYVNNLAGK